MIAIILVGKVDDTMRRQTGAASTLGWIARELFQRSVGLNYGCRVMGDQA